VASHIRYRVRYIQGDVEAEDDSELRRVGHQLLRTLLSRALHSIKISSGVRLISFSTFLPTSTPLSPSTSNPSSPAFYSSLTRPRRSSSDNPLARDAFSLTIPLDARLLTRRCRLFPSTPAEHICTSTLPLGVVGDAMETQVETPCREPLLKRLMYRCSVLGMPNNDGLSLSSQTTTTALMVVCTTTACVRSTLPSASLTWRWWRDLSVKLVIEGRSTWEDE